ncbi:unnamed protein product [Sphagnum troendelagicum]|uniref:Coiled-coil domain-containing protein SCD2 n=1 Tax=Sphagnum troendelagicum TaxID=128251 RepID=A0ABP0U1Z2_9BRYO
MADRERSSSPSFAGQRTTAGGLGVPPAQQVKPGAINPLKKSQNYAAKAAAARLAKVMQASRDSVDDDDEDDDHHFPHFGPDGSNARDLSPKLMRAYDSSNGPLAAGLRSATFGRSTLKPTLVPPLVPVNPRPRPALAVVPSVLRVKDPAPAPVIDRTRRYPIDLAHESRGQDLTGPNSRRETAALRDEIDILQEENEALLDKLRLVEEKLAEKDTRSRELEKQVASLGEGISLESRLLNRKEQFLKQREAAIRVAKEQSKDVKDEEIANLRLEVEAARDEVMAASEAAREVDIEVRALRTMTHRMILTQEEMEEVVLKRCWLARYWALAVRLDIHPEIAHGKKEFWSSLAPLPLEVVLSAGQRAKEQSSSQSQDGSSENGGKKSKPTRDVNDITGDGNIESMLAVEKGLRELASLKIEDAVMLALSRHRYPVFGWDLSPMEVEDVQFRQAWLIYFWRRAKNNGVEDDIADERLQFWISRTMHQPAPHDEVDVQRGLMELKRLGIEEQLWNVSRREIAHEAANQKLDVLEVLAPASLQRAISAPSIHNG